MRSKHFIVLQARRALEGPRPDIQHSIIADYYDPALLPPITTEGEEKPYQETSEYRLNETRSS